MGFLDNLKTLDQRPRGGWPDTKPAKDGKPTVIARKERKKSREQQHEEFRAAVWKRDGGKSRATGKKLAKSGLEWSAVGEVDHVYERSTNPDRIFDVSNGILLSKEENRLKKARCSKAPEHHYFEIVGPDDRSQPQMFFWRDDDGKVIRKAGPR